MGNRFENFSLGELVLLKYSTKSLIDELEKFPISRKDNENNLKNLKNLKNEIVEQIVSLTATGYEF